MRCASSPDAWTPLAILGSEIPFPFDLEPSSLDVSGIDKTVRSTMPLLEHWGIAARLTSLQGYEGCHRGYVTDLAERWLQGLDADSLRQVEIFACGPTPMLRAVADARRPLRPALPGVTRGIHGLRGGRLCRLHGQDQYAGRPGHETRLRRRARFRRSHRRLVTRPAVLAATP